MNFFQYTLLLKINVNIFYPSHLKTCKNNNVKKKSLKDILIYTKEIFKISISFTNVIFRISHLIEKEGVKNKFEKEIEMKSYPKNY